MHLSRLLISSHYSCIVYFFLSKKFFFHYKFEITPCVHMQRGASKAARGGTSARRGRTKEEVCFFRQHQATTKKGGRQFLIRETLQRGIAALCPYQVLFCSNMQNIIITIKRRKKTKTKIAIEKS